MTEAMSGQERVLAVLRRTEPDRVPTFEWLIDPRIVRAMGYVSYEDFVEQSDWDAVVCSPVYLKAPVSPDGMLRDEWGITRRVAGDGYAMAWDELVPIKGPADLERWQPPDPHATFRYEPLQQLVRRFKGRKAIIVSVRDVTSHPRDMLGYVQMLVDCIERPDLVSALVEQCVDHTVAVIERCAELGADIIHTGDDIADNKAPLVSPGTYRSLFIPHLRRLIEAIHACGLYHWKHSDGNLMPLMDMLVEAGIDAIDPVDPLGGIILSSRISAGSSKIAAGLEFEVIAAVIIGGTSLAGGQGSIVGTFLGVLFIGLLGNGMVLMGVDPFAQEVISGLIILVAVLISELQKPARR